MPAAGFVDRAVYLPGPRTSSARKSQRPGQGPDQDGQDDHGEEGRQPPRLFPGCGPRGRPVCGPSVRLFRAAPEPVLPSVSASLANAVVA